MNHFWKCLRKKKKYFSLFFSSKTVHPQERVLFKFKISHFQKQIASEKEGLKNKTTSALFQESRLLTKNGQL